MHDFTIIGPFCLISLIFFFKTKYPNKSKRSLTPIAHCIQQEMWADIGRVQDLAIINHEYLSAQGRRDGPPYHRLISREIALSLGL